MTSASKLALVLCALLLLVSTGCGGLTIGPVVERKAVIVRAGTAIEVLENVTVRAHILKESVGEVDPFQQDIGGWIVVHPDHWEAIKREMARLREKAGEKEGPK